VFDRARIGGPAATPLIILAGFSLQLRLDGNAPAQCQLACASRGSSVSGGYRRFFSLPRDDEFADESCTRYLGNLGREKACRVRSRRRGKFITREMSHQKEFLDDDRWSTWAPACFRVAKLLDWICLSCSPPAASNWCTISSDKPVGLDVALGDVTVGSYKRRAKIGRVLCECSGPRST
jgi:hypothetical protein